MKVSKEIDALINKFYEKEKQYKEENTMKQAYDKSMKELKNLTIDLDKFPYVKTWNQYASKNACLSHVSLEYISRIKLA